MATPPSKPGPGRPKGSANKITKDIREAISQAFDKAGGIEYLVQVSKTKPEVFCSLLGKIIPAEVRAKVDATLNVATGVPRD